MPSIRQVLLSVVVPFWILGTQAASLPPHQPRADDCPVPEWSVAIHNVTYSPEIRYPGSTSFTLKNSVTGASEELTCPLRSNTICDMKGTPLDKTLHLWLQVNMGLAVVSVNQTTTCTLDGKSPVFVIGTVELDVTCPDELSDVMTCTGNSGVIKGRLETA